MFFVFYRSVDVDSVIHSRGMEDGEAVPWSRLSRRASSGAAVAAYAGRTDWLTAYAVAVPGSVSTFG